MFSFYILPDTFIINVCNIHCWKYFRDTIDVSTNEHAIFQEKNRKRFVARKIGLSSTCSTVVGGADFFGKKVHYYSGFFADIHAHVLHVERY